MRFSPKRSAARKFPAIRYFIFVTTDSTSQGALPVSRARRETEAAAERLNAQIEAALAAVTDNSPDDSDDLEACADRLERAARDMTVALRELVARRRQINQDE